MHNALKEIFYVRKQFFGFCLGLKAIKNAHTPSTSRQLICWIWLRSARYYNINNDVTVRPVAFALMNNMVDHSVESVYALVR